MKYLLLFMPLALFASDGGETDIIERTINFFIFSGILYYLIADKVKEAYKARISGIADKLEAIQATLKASKDKREAAKAKVEKAKEDSKALIVTSKKEAQILVKKLEDDLENDIAILEKSHAERIIIEKRHMKREVISDVLEQMFDGNDLAIDRQQVIDIILKKVA